MSYPTRFIVNHTSGDLQRKVAAAVSARTSIELSILTDTGVSSITLRVRLVEVDRGTIISLVVGVVLSEDGDDVSMVDIFCSDNDQPTGRIRDIIL